MIHIRQLQREGLLLFVIISIFFIASCSSSKKAKDPASVVIPATSPNDVHWTYQDKAISLEVRADKLLNEYDEMPHTLALCLYQLSDKNLFAELISTVSGQEKLLQCNSFDKSIVQSQQKFIQPGQTITFSLNRAEGARYLSVVAGYFKRNINGVSKIWSIPVNVDKPGIFFWQDTLYTPGKLSAILILGPHHLQKVGK
ncbi:type VI secretion lipoprotein TssJ [Celerinatantimonas sp. MCCC 1A17872]|uniref:type VI secretion lipoprotein TssJ n=1 Tax=Celerinatantimonas sp. MCCC 1A17872 TaxID=3177514 RepID=UPI0038C59E64